MKFQRGFTLIELLVVVAIISLLSSVVLASLRQARIRAQETHLVQTLQEIQKELELFRSNNNRYPSGVFSYNAFSSAGNQGDDPGYNRIVDTDLDGLGLEKYFSSIKLQNIYIYYEPKTYGSGLTDVLNCGSYGTSGQIEEYTIAIAYNSSSDFDILDSLEDATWVDTSDFQNGFAFNDQGTRPPGLGTGAACVSSPK